MKRLIPILALLINIAPADDEPIVAVYDLQGALSENGMMEESILSMDFSPKLPLTFHDLSKGIKEAASAEEVTAIVVDIDDAMMTFAQLTELRGHLLAARESGKDVWLYSDYYANPTAILGSAANHFVLMPEAGVDFSGINAESMYFKGLLDKAGLEVDVIHIGDFKSFGEEFYREGPSEFAAKQTEELIDGIFNEIIDLVADGREMERTKVIEMVDRGTFNAQEAKEAGLIDDLQYRTDFNTHLREKYADAEFSHDYGLPDLDGPEIKGIFDLFKLMLSSGDDDDKGREDYIAVVVLEGAIDDDSIAPVRKAILDRLEDEHAKALVLRVDSPGGSALSSEVLWEATDEWKASGRPMVVSMGSVAASGGYYVSAGADRIFAEPGTITGSIGVVGMKFVAGGALEKLGITTHSIQRGKHADAMSMTTPFTPEQAKIVRESMTEVYGTFKKRIEDGRGDKLKGELEGMAGGRVYTGRRALELGLVDQLGGLTDAIDWIAKESGIEGADSQLFPQPKSFLEGLFSSPEKDEDGELVSMSAKPAPVSGFVRNAIQDVGLSALPTNMRVEVRRAFRRLESASKSNIQLLGPDLRIAW